MAHTMKLALLVLLLGVVVSQEELGSTEYSTTSSIPYQENHFNTDTAGSGSLGGFGGLGGGGGGCSSNFWASNPGAWPNLLNLYTSVTQVLGQIAYSIFGGPTTLISALQNQSSDPYSSLLREATAAMLNSYSRPGFKYSPSAVRSSFQQGLASKRSAKVQASLFQQANSGSGSCS